MMMAMVTMNGDDGNGDNDGDDGDDDSGEQSLVRNDLVIESGLCPNDDQGLSF